MCTPQLEPNPTTYPQRHPLIVMTEVFPLQVNIVGLVKWDDESLCNQQISNNYRTFARIWNKLKILEIYVKLTYVRHNTCHQFVFIEHFMV